MDDKPPGVTGRLVTHATVIVCLLDLAVMLPIAFTAMLMRHLAIKLRLPQSWQARLGNIFKNRMSPFLEDRIKRTNVAMDSIKTKSPPNP